MCIIIQYFQFVDLSRQSNELFFLVLSLTSLVIIRIYRSFSLSSIFSPDFFHSSFRRLLLILYLATLFSYSDLTRNYGSVKISFFIPLSLFFSIFRRRFSLICLSQDQKGDLIKKPVFLYYIIKSIIHTYSMLCRLNITLPQFSDNFINITYFQLLFESEIPHIINNNS